MIVASVQESIDSGRAVEETGPRASRNRLQTTTLLDAIAANGFDAALGGARRDEERARAKERVFSFRDDMGQWDPKNQRPELWSLFNGRVRKGEHVRVFPLSNWTELDVWRYIAAEELEVPPIYFAHDRSVIERDGMLLADSEFVPRLPDEEPFEASVRYRTVGDMAVTGAVRSEAATLEDGGGRDRHHARDRARRDPGRRPRVAGRDGGPQARGLLLMDDANPLDAPPELLRVVTAGSVDDGKSTLIGRLLHDTKSILDDQLDAVEVTSRERGDGRLRPRAAHRRPARRARAGHHDRRRLPLLRHPAALVHPRRHARPRPLHAQHGHRRVDRRRRDRADRRPPGRGRAVQAPRLHRRAAARAARGRVREQDGPRRLGPRRVRRDPRGPRRRSPAASGSPSWRASRSRR